MKFGVVYPQTEFGSDPSAIRDYAQSAESLGYSHIVAYDHVLGANPDRPGGWRGTYNYQSAFQEIMVLFGYLASITRQIGFLSGIIILPQRQTALVAKQAATLDVLSQGRLRLGVGLGWNEIEYIALNENFHNRGKRMEEQIEVLRLLWTQPLVNFKGKYHTIPDAGLNPLPVQKPIPIWFGGTADEALRRAARIGNGWLPNTRTPADAKPLLDKIDQHLQEAGRSRANFGVEARMVYGEGNPQAWMTTIREWEDLGAECIDLNTMGSSFQTPAEHLAAIRQFASTVMPT